MTYSDRGSLTRATDLGPWNLSSGGPRPQTWKLNQSKRKLSGGERRGQTLIDG